MDERKIQKSFVDQITGRKKVKEKSIGVYKYLVHHSFYDVLTNTYPIFSNLIKKKNFIKEFDKSIFKFMQTSAISPYIWQMPNEYRKFIKKSKFLKKIKYLDDLLHFEYTELYLFMQKNKSKKHTKFNMTNNYTISKSVLLHKYQYNVLASNFEDKEKTFVLGYFDFKLQEVAYRPMNDLLFKFLNFIDKKISLKSNLRLFLKKNQIPYKDYVKEFEKALKELANQKVLV
jgi:hypothetical protein